MGVGDSLEQPLEDGVVESGMCINKRIEAD